MDATLLLLSADCTATASGRLRPRLPAGPHVASPGPSARPRTSIRASAASAALAVRGLPHHASVAGVGVVSDYDLLALDSISGAGLAEADIFPEVDSTWKTFREIQRLLSKTNGKVIGDVMTSAPLVVRETTNLEDAARLLLVTKYRRLPVVDSSGKLVRTLLRFLCPFPLVLLP